MPITPFHFGPGAALQVVAPQYVSFIAFGAVNVVIDIESLYNMLNDRYPIHAFLHTYVGATVAIAITIAMFLLALKVARAWRLPNPFNWQSLSLVQIVVGAVLGGYSHVVLDSVMHADIRPLLPFSSSNELLGYVPIGMLHLFCAGMAVVGLVGWLYRRFVHRTP